MRSGDARRPVRVEVLGPLRLFVDELPVDVRGPKRRAVLALLALAEGRTVTVDHLLDALWPAELPESGRQALHSHVSRLRAHLGPAADRLTTLHDGYRLGLGADELDLTHARTMLRVARAEAGHDPAGAYARLRQAHRLWRGPMLADLADVAPIAATVEGCAQLHREVTDALITAAIAAGRAEDVVATAGAAVADDPLREPAVLLLMRALAAAGRTPDALRTGREYRRRLADETGLDPSPALDELERDVARGIAGPAPARPAAAAPARSTTRLIGREAEVAAVHRLLATERLVTLVGPGGVGKTRVALEVGHRSGTVSALLLAPVTERESIAHALAAALNLNVVRGDVLSACVAVLGDRPRLLLIDNCEHLLDAVRDTVSVLLSGCPRLSVLATSREPLGLAEEHVSRLAPLPLPSAGQELAAVPSVAVFLDRAARVRPGPPDLATVADIVRRLDGMPLAIELAAGRLSTFSLTELRDRLDRALDLLSGGRPSGEARHRTLRATVEWSYRLLAADEQRLFRHLSVFVDGVDLATAERVAADLDPAGDAGSVLARLVDASMIEAVFHEAGTRYRMLDTLRAFGLDRLAAAGEQDGAQQRLVRWAVELAAWVDTTASTEREPEADAVLRRELANLRAAWRLARNRGLIDEAATVVQALFHAVFSRDLVEFRDWARELADDPALDGHPRAAAVLGTAAYAAYAGGDHREAERLAGAGLRLADGGDGSSLCRHALAVALLARGEYREVVEHCLAGAAGGDSQHGFLGIAALAAAYTGDHDEARRLNDGWLASAIPPSALAWGAYYAGEIENAAGRTEAAEEHYVRAIELARASGATFAVGVATVGLNSVRATAGRVEEALAGYREAVGYFARTGNWTHLWVTLRNLADLLVRLGDQHTAAVLDAAADAAPDAPADPNRDRGPRSGPVSSPPGRADVLEIARRAIAQHLPDA